MRQQSLLVGWSSAAVGRVAVKARLARVAARRARRAAARAIRLVRDRVVGADLHRAAERARRRLAAACGARTSLCLRAARVAAALVGLRKRLIERIALNSKIEIKVFCLWKRK